MDSIIHLLPDSVANQIAAGEVIQRPASVVKELVENAIDAGATQIDVVLKDAGRTLIRVTDNGKGMTPADARLAFERHATSKIQQATDLFQLRTMGFRGEALASIASVAQVELVTRRSEDELAWKVEIEGSVVTNEEPTLAAQGSKFSVRNLFFNIPARRKFLGENAKELRAIRDEFFQIALVYPQIQFSLTHNDDVLYQLLPGNTIQRILSLFGKRNGGQLNKHLYPVDVSTQLIRITGYVGDPAAACQRDYMQYLFVNGRFIKHKAFRAAVLKAYELLVPQGQYPTYFLYLEVDTETLDVNIHPTKTEVKFENESSLWPIIHATVREALGKSNAVPSIDFDREDAPEIRVFTGEREVSSPKVHFNPSYNPFKSTPDVPSKTQPNWETLLQGFERKGSALDYLGESDSVQPSEYRTPGEDEPSLEFRESSDGVFSPLLQLYNRYLLVQSPMGYLLVDQQLAHVRVLYDRFVISREQAKVASQTLLFPEILEFDPIKQSQFLSVADVFTAYGFNIECRDEAFYLNAIPPEIEASDAVRLLSELLDSFVEAGPCPLEERTKNVALGLAQTAAISQNKFLSESEQRDLIERLFQLTENRFSPDGKRIWTQLSEDHLKKILHT